MTDEQLLIPLGQASRMLGITKQTLRRHVKDGLVKTVKVGPRAFVPRAEMDRLLSGQPIEKLETGGIAVLSPLPANQNRTTGENTAEWVEKLPNGKINSPLTAKERLDEILYGYADFLEEQENQNGPV